MRRTRSRAHRASLADTDAHCGQGRGWLSLRYPASGRGRRNHLLRHLTMGIGPFDHPLLGHLLGDPETEALLSADVTIARMLLFERALAKAEAGGRTDPRRSCRSDRSEACRGSPGCRGTGFGNGAGRGRGSGPGAPAEGPARSGAGRASPQGCDEPGPDRHGGDARAARRAYPRAAPARRAGRGADAAFFALRHDDGDGAYAHAGGASRSCGTQDRVVAGAAAAPPPPHCRRRRSQCRPHLRRCRRHARCPGCKKDLLSRRVWPRRSASARPRAPGTRSATVSWRSPARSPSSPEVSASSGRTWRSQRSRRQARSASQPAAVPLPCRTRPIR